MSAEIYYFSGTGNCLSVANQIAKRLNGAKVKSILKSMGGLKGRGRIDTAADIVGIIYPVYCVRAPKLVREFVERLDIPADTYVFAITTCGAMAGNSIADVAGILKKKGHLLSYGEIAYMPDNSIAFPSPIEKHIEMLDKAHELVDEICDDVLVRKIEKVSGRNFVYDILGSLTWGFIQMGVKFQKANVKKCTKCKVCVNACPVENIELKDDKIVFGDKCQACFACIQGCPQNAITFGMIKRNDKTKYFNPDIKPLDIGKQR